MIDDDEADVMDAGIMETDDIESSDFEAPAFDASDDLESAAGFDGMDDGETVQAEGKPDLNLIMDIPVTMQVVLGKAVMPVASLVKLGRGAVVKLDTSIGDPVDLIVNGRIVARGEVVVLENEESRFGITLTEIVSPGARPQRAKASAA
jgi:flagellar motor switch protein FliN/FliY